MLLNCTRLSTVWTSLRVSQLRRSATNTFYVNPCLAGRKGIFSKPVQILLSRRSLHTVISSKSVSHSGSMPKRQRLLECARWTRMQFARRRNRDSVESETQSNAADASARANQTPPVEQSPPKVKLRKSDFVRLIELSKSEKYVLLAAMGCLLVSSIITMSVPFALGRVIDIIFTKEESGDDEAMKRLSVFSAILLGVFIIGGFANFGRVYLFNTASLRIVRNLRSKVYNTMLLQEPSWFDTKGTGELINRVVNDTFFVGNSLSQNLSDGLRSMAMISVGTGMMIYTSPELALVSSLVLPVMAGVAIVYGRYVRRTTREMLDKFAAISKYAEERFGNIKTVKIFCRENEETASYNRQLNDAMSIGYKEVRARSVFFGLTGFSGNIIIISVLYYGGTLVMDHSLTIGQLTAFMLYAGYVAISMNGLSNFYSELNKGVGAAQRLWEILDRPYEIPIDKGIVPLEKPIGEIQFDQVGFYFPTRPGSMVLNDFNLVLMPGKTTAVVGRSGSGKTTIANIVLRLYDPQEGQVLLDGQDLRTLNPHWVRSHISAVSQEPVLFSGTIRENILYGLNPGTTVSEEVFEEVVRESHVDEFSSTLPEGLETVVGQRGHMLSGGQKQRVAIARALIRNPTILVLDEATSALDSMSEELVQMALDRMIRGRTVLTIAHRLSTIRNADKIAVVDSGHVIEEGTYDSLMSIEDGAFKELVAKQAFVGEK